MRALVFDGQVRLATDYPQPKPVVDEVLIRVTLAGICQTDIEVTRGYMDFRGVMGHEFVGVVESAGGRAGEGWKGKRVVGEINCVCGKCEMCLAGLKGHCLRRTVIGIDNRDGCFAEYLTLPAANLHEIPAGVSDREAVFTEPLAAALQVVQQVRPSPRDKAVVIGDGRLGQLIARVLQSRGLRPLVIGRDDDKLRRLERLGISCLTADEARPRHDAHLVVEASGSVDGLTMAMEMVRPRGTIVLKSTIAAKSGINLAPIVVDEVCVLGSRCGPFSEALAALGQRTVEIGDLVTGEFSLQDGVRALEAAQARGAIKILVKP